MTKQCFQSYVLILQLLWLDINCFHSFRLPHCSLSLLLARSRQAVQILGRFTNITADLRCSSILGWFTNITADLRGSSKLTCSIYANLLPPLIISRRLNNIGQQSTLRNHKGQKNGIINFMIKKGMNVSDSVEAVRGLVGDEEKRAYVGRTSTFCLVCKISSFCGCFYWTWWVKELQ